ncbi:hypothetical protein D3C76_1482720 [compost metagenome]
MFVLLQALDGGLEQGLQGADGEADMKNAFEYEAELAALREELANETERANTNALRARHAKQDLNSIQQRLADAERRNGVMRDQLTKAAGLLEEGQRLARNDGSSLWEVVNEFLPEINPTEPGASE